MQLLFRETEMVPTELPEDRAPGAKTDGRIRDGGAGTVMSIGICLALLAAAVAGLLMVQVAVAAVRAATAADLAALAGADTLRGLGPTGLLKPPEPGVDQELTQEPDQETQLAPGPATGPGAPDDRTGPGAPFGQAAAGAACAAAGETAARNKARLTSCSADLNRNTVMVEVEVAIPALPVPASALARAGPPS